MRGERDGATRRVRRPKRRGIPFRLQVALVGLVALAIGYGLGYYLISLLTMPQPSVGETLVSSPPPPSSVAVSSPATTPAARTQERPASTTSSSSAPSSSAPAPAPASSAPSSGSGESSGGLYRVQVGAFMDRDRALVEQLQAQGFEASITSGPPYRVQAGAFRSEAGAAARLEALRAAGDPDAFSQRSP
jgi:cell division septation protein DedD